VSAAFQISGEFPSLKLRSWTPTVSGGCQGIVRDASDFAWPQPWPPLSEPADQLGQGRVMLLIDNPNFRGYWRGMNRLLFNALFFGDHIRAPRRRGQHASRQREWCSLDRFEKPDKRERRYR
jgi:hypothetical protein